MYQSKSSLLATASTFFLFALFLGVKATPLAVAQVRPAGPGSSMEGTQGPSAAQMPGPAAETTAEQPRVHFQAARRAFDSGNYNASADHIMAGVAEMRREANNATPENARNLRDAADNLTDLADRVRRGEVKSDATLRSNFADAYSALSQHYYQQARSSWESKGPAGAPPNERQGRTGHYLSAAADNFRNWAEETGTDIKGGTRGVLDATEDVAGHLVSGTGRVVQGAGTAIDKFGDMMRGYGTRMKIRAHGPATTEGTQPGPVPPTAPAPGAQPAPGTSEPPSRY